MVTPRAGSHPLWGWIIVSEGKRIQCHQRPFRFKGAHLILFLHGVQPEAVGAPMKGVLGLHRELSENLLILLSSSNTRGSSDKLSLTASKPHP